MHPWINLAILGLLAPLALFPTPTRFCALLVVPALWIMRWAAGRRTSPAGANFIPRTPLDVAVLCLATMIVVSMYATFDVAFSLPKIAGLVYGIAVFYATVDATRSSDRALAWGVALFLAIGVGLAGLSLLGARWPAKFPVLAPLWERLPAAIRGLPGAEAGFQANEVAGALLWFVPLALALCLFALFWGRNLGWRRWGLALGSGFALGVIGGTLLLTQSRGGLAGLVVGLVGMLAFIGWWGRGVVLALVGAALWGVYQVGWERIGAILFGSESLEAVGTMSLSGRIELWSRAIYGIQDFPFTGMGLNAFRRVVPVLYPLFLVGPDTDIAHAHNLWLQAALDLGLPGLIAYLALWMVTVCLLLSAWRARGAALWLRAAALGVLGGLIAHFVYGITDTVALGAKPGFALWMLLGLAVAIWQRSAQAPQ